MELYQSTIFNKEPEINEKLGLNLLRLSKEVPL